MLFKINNDFEIITFDKRLSLSKVKKLNNKNIKYSYKQKIRSNLIKEAQNNGARGFVYFFNGISNKLDKIISLEKYQGFKKNYSDALNKLSYLNKERRARFKSKIIKMALALVMCFTLFFMVYLTQKKVVTIIYNNKPEKVTTIQFSQDRLIQKFALQKKVSDYEFACNGKGIVKTGLTCTFDTEKQLEITLNGKKQTITTYKSNLKDLVSELSEKNLKDKKGVTYLVKDYDKDLDKVDLTLIKSFVFYEKVTKVTTKTETVAYKTVYKENKKLESGQTKVAQKGVEGKQEVQYTTVYLDGKKQKTTSKVIKVITKKKDKIIEYGANVVTTSSSVWDKLAQCESGGNWAANTGNGFYGGLQFTASTWNNAAAHVGVTAPYAYLASREDQIKAATWLQTHAASGWGQWPACAAKLGLR
jgi:uncharacterized protein YabE (DUF348 family)